MTFVQQRPINNPKQKGLVNTEIRNNTVIYKGYLHLTKNIKGNFGLQDFFNYCVCYC